MSSTTRLVLRRVGRRNLDDVRHVLVDVYREVYTEQIATDPFFSPERFAGRLASHTSSPRWEAVIGYDGDEPVGYAYGSPLPVLSTWWKGVVPEPSAEFAREDGTRTLALWELMVRTPWRGTGVARVLHDELLAHRAEERVVLSVEHDHDRVLNLYRRWGYTEVGTVRDAPDAPIFAIMSRHRALNADAP